MTTEERYAEATRAFRAFSDAMMRAVERHDEQMRAFADAVMRSLKR